MLSVHWWRKFTQCLQPRLFLQTPDYTLNCWFQSCTWMPNIKHSVAQNRAPDPASLHSPPFLGLLNGTTGLLSLRSQSLLSLSSTSSSLLNHVTSTSKTPLTRQVHCHQQDLSYHYFSPSLWVLTPPSNPFTTDQTILQLKPPLPTSWLPLVRIKPNSWTWLYNPFMSLISLHSSLFSSQRPCMCFFLLLRTLFPLFPNDPVVTFLSSFISQLKC